LRLSGSGLSQPIRVQKIVLTPSVTVPGQSEALTATINLPEGGVVPLVFTAHIAISGYQLTIHGPGSPARVRELARAGGLPDAAALDAIAGEPVNLDLSIEGPWLPAPITSVDGSASTTVPDRLAGTVTLHNANWKSDSFPTAVLISQATLHLGAKELRWDPVAFSYGLVKGTATLRIPAACEAPAQCPPTLDLQFATLDAAELQTTLLGAQEPGTLLSTVIARFSPSSTPEWPAFEGTVKADSLILGPITLHNAVAEISVTQTMAEFRSFTADLLNGQIDATGKLTKGDKPTYSFEGQFQKLSPPAVCELLGLQCTGGSIDGNGKIDLAGFTGEGLASSAKGNVHIDWRQGAFTNHAASPTATLPAPLTRFDQWTADAEIANGAVTLKENQVRQGSRKSAVEAVVIFGDPPKVNFAAPRPATLSKK
jgi:AsmA-like C-terminal region